MPDRIGAYASQVTFFYYAGLDAAERFYGGMR
jgi:hypothetical protein